MSEEYIPEFEDRLRRLLARTAEAIPDDTDIAPRVRQAARRVRGASGTTGPRSLLAAVAAVLVVALLAGVLTFFHLGHTQHPAGNVIGKPTATQLPTATEAPTASVTATVSSLVIVPNVVGLPYSQAVLAIQQAGLQAVINAEPSSNVAVGLVISTNPPAGTQVPSTQVVTVIYAEPQPTTAPPTPTPH